MIRTLMHKALLLVVQVIGVLAVGVRLFSSETPTWTFSPSAQFVNVAVTFTITGARLSSTDLVAIATSCNSGIENQSSILLGGEPHRFSNISLDGRQGWVAFTLRDIVAKCLVCIKFESSSEWFRVSTSTFESKNAVVDSAWTGAIEQPGIRESIMLQSGERLQVFLSGGGLVKGIDRLAVKFATYRSFCSSPAHSLIEPQELAATYDEGTKAVLDVTVLIQSGHIEPVMCIAVNGASFLEVKTLQFAYVSRYAREFRGVASILPSISTTFTIIGQNFDRTVPVFIKLDRSCDGVSAFSEIEGGDGILATVVNSSCAEAHFRMFPISDEILFVNVADSGFGYQNGVLIPRGGGGRFFSGAFSVGPLGNIVNTYITSPGEFYSYDPILDLGYTDLGNCSHDFHPENCSMTGSVVEVVKGLGATRGCFAETVEIVGVGGGGFGFKAKIINDEIGQINGFDIVNHGYGYTNPPQLVVNYYAYVGACKCGTVFFNGQPTSASLLSGTIVGNMDSCFTASIARGGSVVVSDSGWRRRENLRLCARLGSLAQWLQVGNTTLNIQQAKTTATFMPSIVDSFDPFLLTVTGTGFEKSGSMQTKIKLSEDCSAFSYEDSYSTISGGMGKICESLQMNFDGTLQICIISFTLSTYSTSKLKVCRRIGIGQYRAISENNLTVNPFIISSFAPVIFHSTMIARVTVFGSNFGQGSLRSIKLRGCSKYVCDQGAEGANNGEPCGGYEDKRTCLGNSRCVTRQNSTNFVNLSESNCSLVGGEPVFPTSTGGCLRPASNCSYLVFSFVFLSMADVIGDFTWSFESSTFHVLNSSSFVLNGSKILKTAGFPSAVRSLSAFSFLVYGINLNDSDFAVAKFKFSNSSNCMLGNTNDDDFSVLGGSGKSLRDLQATETVGVLAGTLSFKLIAQERFESILTDWRIDYKFQKSKLCWKIGPYFYRDLDTTMTITLETTRIIGFSPSDGMKGLSSGFLYADQPIPAFKSNEVLTVTVAGRNIGDMYSGIVIRPIPMPFALDAGSSQQCVSSSTTRGNRPTTCKEFPIAQEDPFGGAAEICETGSTINAVLIQDEKPTSVHSSGVVVPSSNMYLTGVSFDEVDYAIFQFKRTMLRTETRFMLCWKAVADNSHDSAWQPIGNLISRQAVFQTYFVFSSQTFILSGAFVASVEPSVVMSNQPISLFLKSSGVRCKDAEIKIKLTTGNTLQSAIGKPIGKGCTSNTDSDSDEALDGSYAVFALCQKVSNDDDGYQVLYANFPRISVQHETSLEVCWSMAYGDTVYDNIFLSVNRTSIAEITILPSFLVSFQINNAQPGEQIIYPHTQLSLTMSGHGLSVKGIDSLRVKISEDCANENSTIPGGEERSASCVFNFSYATTEFSLKTSSVKAKLCVESRKSDVVWVDYLDGFKCDPLRCGAPVCTSGNYILDSFQCDRACCQETCAADRNCYYYTWYEIPSRVYRRCQISSVCNSFSAPVNTITIPHVLQKTRYLLRSWQQVGPSFVISDPEIRFVTPQARPRPVSGTTFVVNLQGHGMGPQHMQVHVKLVSKTLFDGGCNNDTAKRESLGKFQALEAQKAAALEYRIYLKNLNMNGTCAAGNKNCKEGPAPPLTVCSVDSDCWGPSGAAGGGLCVGPNTGFSCLWDSDCTNGGFCNNSLAYLTLLPLPEIPEIRIPYSDLSYENAVDGGYGRFVDPTNHSFASLFFSVHETGDVVFCVAFRDDYKESSFLQGGYVTDSRLISNLYGYTAMATFSIDTPAILEIFPDHIFTNINTIFSFGGFGFSPLDKVKLVYAKTGCTSRGLSIDEADLFGIVLGTKPSNFEMITSLRNNASVSFSVPLDGGSYDGDIVLCYAFHGTKYDGYYQAVGNITIVNRPPIITSFSPGLIFSFEVTQFSILGTGLGGAQKLKLCTPGTSCRGADMDEALSDIYCQATGTMHSVVEVHSPRGFAKLDSPKFANVVFVMQMSAVFQVNVFSPSDRSLELCISFSDVFDDEHHNFTSGYHAVGMISWNQPVVNNLLTQFIESGTWSSVVVSGEGLKTALTSYMKLVESYSSCSEPESRIVIGGDITVFDSLNSSALQATVFIPSGVSTRATVCHRFGEQANRFVSEWEKVGTLEIRLPSPQFVAVVSPIRRLMESISPEKEFRASIVLGEPFSIFASFTHLKQSNFFIKIVPSTVVCKGGDPFSDAFEGGEAQQASYDGIIKLEQGIAIPAGLTPPLKAKVCILHQGSIGYVDSFLGSSWEIVEPHVDSISPLMTSSDHPITIKLYGRGIATAKIPSFIFSASNLSCLDRIQEVQVQSDDNGEGFRASATFPSESNAILPLSIALCWSWDYKVVPLQNVLVHRFPSISGIFPRHVFLGNRTAFLLVGNGLNSNVVLKFSAMSLDCSGTAEVENCQQSVGNNSDSECIETQYTDQQGLVLLSEPFSFFNSGILRLCFAPAWGYKFEDSGFSISVDLWHPVYVLADSEAENNVDASKTDVQRVEARMSNQVPPCTRVWRSDYMLLSQKQSVDRESPFIYSIDSNIKCWTTCNLVPDGYSTTGLCPPGIDLNLKSPFRGVPMELILVGGLDISDQIFISNSCGDDLTRPSLNLNEEIVAGGGPVTLNDSHRLDVTELVCDKTRASLDLNITGLQSRVMGWKITFSLRRVSEPGTFHRLCILRKDHAAAFSVPGISIKVQPPKLISAEPSTIWAGRNVSIRLNGAGLSSKDKIKIIDGETDLSCYNNDSTSSLPGSFTAELNGGTTLFHSDVFVQFDIPSTHARICYMYYGSSEWEEMTRLLSLRTSGYVYGYESSTHFYYGETLHLQNDSNWIGGSNQTVLVLAPKPLKVREKSVYSRTVSFQLTIDGYGLTQSTHVAVMPSARKCGGRVAPRINKIQDTGSLSSTLYTVPGGETRHPTYFINDGLSGHDILASCSGSTQVDSCSINADSSIQVSYGSFDIDGIGMARVCVMPAFTSEFFEVGQIDVLRPCITSLFPTSNIVLNHDFLLQIAGLGLNSSDLLKIVEGSSCNGIISSRPYFVSVTVLDPPYNTTAVANMTITGPAGLRKVCYSYDSGLSFVDAGLSLQVTSPRLFSAFPTTISMSAERRITFYGNSISDGDQVQVIYSDRSCEYSSDSDCVFGGKAKFLQVANRLPDDIGAGAWPTPGKSGSAVFLLPRLDLGTICYKPRGAGGWMTATSEQGDAIVLTVIDTDYLALGLPNAGSALAPWPAFWMLAWTLWVMRVDMFLGRAWPAHAPLHPHRTVARPSSRTSPA